MPAVPASYPTIAPRTRQVRSWLYPPRPTPSEREARAGRAGLCYCAGTGGTSGTGGTETRRRSGADRFSSAWHRLLESAWLLWYDPLSTRIRSSTPVAPEHRASSASPQHHPLHRAAVRELRADGRVPPRQVRQRDPRTVLDRQRSGRGLAHPGRTCASVPSGRRMTTTLLPASCWRRTTSTRSPHPRMEPVVDRRVGTFVSGSMGRFPPGWARRCRRVWWRRLSAAPARGCGLRRAGLGGGAARGSRG